MCMSPNYIKAPKSDVSILPESQRFMSVPCGKCEECRLSNSKEWGIRCICELVSHPEYDMTNTFFITLTYDQEHVPPVLMERHMQLFIKRLRKHFAGSKIKYFYCGEYGTKTFRPHYHMIVYGLPLKQLRMYKKNLSGDILWQCDELEQIWQQGAVVVGGVSVKSASYVARYCLKKNDTDCYMRCSKGFGKKYFFDHMDEIVSNGYIWVPCESKIIRAKIPKYFLKLYRVYLNDDEKYRNFLIWKHNQTEKYKKMLIEKTGTLLDIKDLKHWKEIGNEHPALLVAQHHKRLIKQSLNDLYQFREYNESW